jgi:predicted flap endonuclease-1-like 5' DNA nuclease
MAKKNRSDKASAKNAKQPHKSKSDPVAELRQEVERQAARLSHQQGKIRKLKRRVDELESACAVGATSGPDDLTKITGIGRAIQRRLQDAGISTYPQLAAMSVDTRDAVVGSLGTFEQRAQPDVWVNEARNLRGR